MRTLIIVPAFNEEQTIHEVLKDLDESSVDADVVVVNDGSTDATSVVARRSGVSVIDLPLNLGIGGAMQTGFRYALENGYDVAVQFDGDGQHRADQLDLIMEPLNAGEADVIVGSRFLGGGGYRVPFLRKAGIRLFSTVLSMITGSRLTDVTSGFRAYGKNAIQIFSDYYPDDYPEVEAIVILHNKHMTTKEVAVLMRERIMGSSSITPIKSVYYMVKVLLSIILSLGRRGEGPTDS